MCWTCWRIWKRAGFRVCVSGRGERDIRNENLLVAFRPPKGRSQASVLVSGLLSRVGTWLTHR